MPTSIDLGGGGGGGLTQAQVDARVQAVAIDSAPGALDTLNELAAALGDDENYATTTAAAIAAKADAADLTTHESDTTSVHGIADTATLVSDVAANTAKAGNATHSGDVTGSGALTLDPSAISGKALVTADPADHVVLFDATDSALKKALVSDLAGSGATNLAWTAGTSVVSSDTGTDATLTVVDGVNPGLMASADKTKLDGVEASATADQTGAQIKAAYEAETDTNAFTDAEQTKLSAVEPSATADQTAGEIKTAYESNADTNAYDDAAVSAVAANTAKTTNAAHTGEVTGSGALTVDPTAITNKTVVTADAADHVLIADASDSGNLKKALVSDLAGSGATNLSWTAGTSTIASDTGTDAVITAVDGSNAGLMSVADKAKLDGYTPSILSVGTTAPGSPSTNDLWVDTN